MRACSATFTQRGLQVTRFEVAHTAALALGERGGEQQLHHARCSSNRANDKLVEY